MNKYIYGPGMNDRVARFVAISVIPLSLLAAPPISFLAVGIVAAFLSLSYLLWEFKGRQHVLNSTLKFALVNWEDSDIINCIDWGAAVDHRNSFGNTPLILAVRAGDAAVVSALIQAGAAVDQVDSDGDTPLILAVKRGYAAVVRALLEAGAEGDQVDSDGNTPLILAAKRGYAAVVSALLEAGAEGHYSHEEQYRALTIAVENGHTEVVRALLEAGAKVDYSDEEQYRALTAVQKALTIAVQNGHTEIVSLLIPVASEDQTAVVSALLKAGAKSDYEHEKELTALMIAAQKGHEEIVSLLIPTALEDNKNLALIVAADEGHAAVVCALLEAGAERDYSYEGDTALKMAAQNGHTEIVSLLILDASEDNKKEALIMAAECGHINIVNTFIKAGAKPPSYYPAFLDAANNRHVDVVVVLWFYMCLNKSQGFDGQHIVAEQTRKSLSPAGLATFGQAREKLEQLVVAAEAGVYQGPLPHSRSDRAVG